MQGIEDRFETRIAPYWVRFCVGCAGIEHENGVVRLVVDGAEERKLSDAEIDDHRTAPRKFLAWSPPVRMTVRARMSHRAGEMLGTAGFGFWNDPFDWVGNVEAPPNALWFFYASPQSDMAFVPEVAGNGWKAAMLNGGRADPLTMAVGNFVFRLPGMSKVVMNLAQTRLNAGERVLGNVAMNEWHEYQIDWSREAAVFFVDGREVLRVARPPTVPLGFVAWVDNNAAVMGPGRAFDFQRIAVPQRQWMELSYIRLEKVKG
jgi:hypothetical protein